jgi:hypothetical protein
VLRAVLPAGLLGGSLLLVGAAMLLTDQDGGVRLLGATLALLGLLALLPVALVAAPVGSPRVRRDDTGTTVLGSTLPQRLLVVAAVLLTLAATIMAGAVTSPEVLGGGTVRRPTPGLLLVLWPGAAWAWFVALRGRNRQELTVVGDEVTVCRGRESRTVRARRDEVAVGTGGPADRQTVRVGPPADPEPLVLGARHFGTTPRALADALREALPR